MISKRIWGLLAGHGLLRGGLHLGLCGLVIDDAVLFFPLFFPCLSGSLSLDTQAGEKDQKAAMG